MAKADRLDRLDIRRLELEAEYTAALIEALRRSASGKTGLFGRQGGDRKSREAVVPVIESLTELGDAIDRAREQLTMPRFDLHKQFLAARGPVSSQAVGETREAQAWLDRLESPAVQSGAVLDAG
jgi:hypothetical protein